VSERAGGKRRAGQKENLPDGLSGTTLINEEFKLKEKATLLPVDPPIGIIEIFRENLSLHIDSNIFHDIIFINSYLHYTSKLLEVNMC
jgi:hypothetical protein